MRIRPSSRRWLPIRWQSSVRVRFHQRSYQAFRHGSGIFVNQGDSFDAFEFARPLVTSRNDPLVSSFRIRAVRLQKDDRATIEAVGKKITGPHALDLANFQGVGPSVGKSRQPGGFGQGNRHVLGDFPLKQVPTVEQAEQHLETLIVQGQFPSHVTTVDQDVKIIGLAQFLLFRIFPSACIEVKAHDQVRTDFLVYQFGPGMNLTDPVDCLLYTSPSPRDAHESRMPSSA